MENFGKVSKEKEKGKYITSRILEKGITTNILIFKNNEKYHLLMNAKN